MPNVAWKSHKALRCKLARLKIPNSGALSTLLLDTFLLNEGFIPSRLYYKSCFEIKNKNYTQWIEDLKKFGLIEHFKLESSNKSDWIRFKAGSVIRDYINKEKMLNDEIATVQELQNMENRSKEAFATKKELFEVKNQIQTLASQIKKLLEPPVTEEELEEMRKIQEKIAIIASAN